MNATQRLLLLGILLLSALAFTGCKDNPEDECIANCEQTQCTNEALDDAFNSCQLSCVAFHAALEYMVPRGKRDSCARLFNEEMACAFEMACENAVSERCEILLDEDWERTEEERERIYRDACGDLFFN